ncbi:MAG: ABC transporter permease subunit [Spirochaetota bacterium]
MRRSLVSLEVSQTIVGSALWALVLAGLIVMGMAFFPALSSSLGELTTLFENPMMSTVLAAFGAEPQALASLPGFYVTYGSIYVTLLGCIFAGLLGAKRLAGEEGRGTAEYLLTRPVSRSSVYRHKALVVVAQVVVLNVVVFGASVFSLEAFGAGVPKLVRPVPAIVDRIADELEAEPTVVRELFALDRPLFNEVMIAPARAELADASPKELSSAGVDPQTIARLMQRLEASGPEELIADVRASPEEYTALFGGTELSEEEILAGVEETEAELETMWDAFRNDPEQTVGLFRRVPRPFLDDLVSRGRLGELFVRLGLPERLADQVYLRYPLGGVAVLVAYGMLAMLAFAMVGFGVSAFFRSAETPTTVALIVVLAAYMINVLMSAVGGSGALRLLSPFAMINDSIMDPGYRLEAGRVAYYLVLAAAAAVAGEIAYRRKDVYAP